MRRLLLTAAAAMTLAGGTAAALELEEVVVTARKVEENLQEVPVAVTAFTAEQIEEAGFIDLFDLSLATPGFSFERLSRYGTPLGGASRPVIRGMSNILGGANASIFIDGLQYSDSILSFPMDAVERVEVIKGPQAALFGRATFAGAINLITKRGGNEFENKVSARLADRRDYEASFLSRGPLVEDKLFYTAFARVYDFGGFHRNSLDDQRIGDEQSVNFDGALEFRPNETFSARFGLGIGRDDDGASALTLQDRTYNNCYLEVARQYYCGAAVQDIPSVQNLEPFGSDIGIDKDSTRLAAHLEWRLGNFTIRSNTGYFNAEQTYGYDVDLTANSTALGGTFNRIAVSDRKEGSTELIVQHDAGGAVRYLAGIYYYKSRRDFREDRLNGSTVNQGEARVDNLALFGSVSVDFTDRLTGSVELRYADDEIGNDNPGARPSLPLIKDSFDSFSPRITLDWQVSERSMLYASYAQGNKPGDINANPLLSPEYLFAKEEESNNYEIGAKNVFGDGRTTLNLALYAIDWDKQQLTTTVFLTNGNPTSVLVNAGKTKAKGLELELASALTERFTAGLGYSYNDAEFREYDNSDQAALFGDPSARGNQTPNSSKHQLNLFGSYEFPLGNGMTGFLRSDYSYGSKKYAQIHNLAHTGGQSLLNLKVGLRGDAWLLSLFVDNLTDDRTPSTLVRFVDFANILPRGDSMRTSVFARAFFYPLPPKRQLGLKASYSF